MAASMFRSNRGDWRPNACMLALSVAFAAPAWANPGGAAVVAGQASIVSNGNLTTVTNSNGAIIHWQSFSIGRDEITRFVQPSAASRVLNRVVGPDPSTLLGRLESNGQVFLVNPAGILVGAGARIDVAGFVASTLNLRNEDFLANRLSFSGDATAGLLRNEGTIVSADGGRVYLVAPRVENAGTIQAPRGEVLLAAGRSVQIGDTGLPGVRIALPADAAINSGSIAAEAGRIGLFGALVKNTGRLNASSAVAEGGRILLKASGTALVEGDGTLEATGTRGGRIEVLGDRVALADRASLDASGATGGGTVLVGGGYQGKDASVSNATVTWMGGNASIRADALDSGDGGQVVVWADDTTRAYGSISARGAAAGGNGGSIETSGKRFLDVEGIRIDAAGPAGAGGNWLLDPEQMRIVNNGNPGTDSNTTASPNFSPVASGTETVLSTTTLNTALNGGGPALQSVTLSTGSGGALTGDIIFDASLGAIVLAKTGTAASGADLNINAYRNVIFTGGSTTFRTTAGAGSTALNVKIYAGTGNTVGPANVFVDAGSTVNLDATATAAVGLHVGNGKTLINNGTVNLGGNSTVYLPTQTDPFTSTSRAATFQNSGTFSNASSAGWFILSNSGLQDGVFDNYGVANTIQGSVEGIWNNRPGSTLNLLGTGILSLQNAQLMRGTIHIPNSAATLQVSEYHGTVARFHDTTATGSGSIAVAGSSFAEADFQRFSGASVKLKVGTSGVAGVSDGTNVFGAVGVGDNGVLNVNNGATLSTVGNLTLGNPSASPATPGFISVNASNLDVGGSLIQSLGTLALTNAKLRVGNALAIAPTMFSLAGNVSIAGGGLVTLASGSLAGAAQLSLSAGGSLDISNATLGATQSISLGAGDAVAINNATIGATATGGTSILSGGSIIKTGASQVGNSTSPLTLAASLVNLSGGTMLGNQTSVIAGNVRVSGGASLVGTTRLRAVVAQNVVVDATSGNSSIVGGQGVNLVLNSPDSILALGTAAGTGAAAIKTGGTDGPINVLFARRAAGGVFVDGVAGVGPGPFRSGFYNGFGAVASAPPAVPGSSLFISYGAVANDVCKVLPGLCVIKPALVVTPPLAPRPALKKDDDDGIGSFGDERPKARRPGVCKAA